MKKIIFNTSSLISLKAELIRKQQEVKEKKNLPEHKVECFKPTPAKTDEKNCSNNKKTFKEKLNETVAEEIEAYRKSRVALEKKAELYEHLADEAGTSQLASRFLVDFKTKKAEKTPERQLLEDKDISPEELNYENNLDDNDWTEFTDCLGRTRKCLKTDLELYIMKDKQLMKAVIKNNEPNNEVNQEDKLPIEKPLLVQTTHDYLQTLREKWEKKEQELMGKDSDIHYQDVLYDEARQHGVSYYSFSTDETERRRQMEELMNLRRETVRAQMDAEKQRKQRDELIQARLDAAKARRRKLLGLPEEDPEEQKQRFTERLLELLSQEKNEAETKAKEEERKLREEKEKERQKLRETYVREWDVGKDGVEDNKGFREMTQEEYVEQQRAKRIDEFAPVSQNRESTSNSFEFDSKGNKTSQAKSWSDVRKPITPSLEISSYQDSKGLFFSSKSSKEQSSMFKNDYSDQNLEAPPPPTVDDWQISSSSRKNSKPNVKYKNFVKSDEYEPIHNELSDEDKPKSVKETIKRKSSSNTAEIAPPTTYEYYGPTPKQQKTQIPFRSDIREAFAQGTKSLEAKESKRQIAKEYDFIL